MIKQNHGFRKLDSPVFARLEQTSFPKASPLDIPTKSSVSDPRGLQGDVRRSSRGGRAGAKSRRGAGPALLPCPQAHLSQTPCPSPPASRWEKPHPITRLFQVLTSVNWGRLCQGIQAPPGNLASLATSGQAWQLFQYSPASSPLQAWGGGGKAGHFTMEQVMGRCLGC